jgi:hypothetical protein
VDFLGCWNTHGLLNHSGILGSYHENLLNRQVGNQEIIEIMRELLMIKQIQKSWKPGNCKENIIQVPFWKHALASCWGLLYGFVDVLD